MPNPKIKKVGKVKPETLRIDCPTFDTGLLALNNSNDKKINLTHCSSIIISEEIAKEDIKPIIFNSENNIELRPTCNILICNGKSEDFIETVGKSPNFSSDIYLQAIKSSKEIGFTTDSILYNFYSDIRYNIKNPTGIYVGNTKDKAEVLGNAVFKESKLVGAISGNEVIYHNIATNKLKSTIIQTPNPFDENKYITYDILTSKKPKINVTIKNNKPIINCKFYIKARISSSQTTNDDYTSKKNNEKIKSSLKNFLNTTITDYFYKTSQDFDSDIVGFEQYLKKQYLTLDEYNSKVNWDKIYKNSEFNVDTQVILDTSYLYQRN